jgi:imidazolonepropionase-like amidohydrolase
MSAIPLLRVLYALTFVNTRTLNLDNKIESVKPGLLADLMVVDGNPLKSISTLRKVKWVMKDGVIYRNDYMGKVE